MGDTADKIKDAVAEGKNMLFGLPPLPVIQPECVGWTTLPKKPNAKGEVFYYVGKDWYPEPKVKCWFYEHQIKVLDGKIAVVDRKILPYEIEIDRIKQYLKKMKLDEDGDELQEASIRDRIEMIQKQLVSLKERGLLPTDVEYRRRVEQIRKLQDQMSKKTPSTESKMHIADWPAEPGGPVLPAQDLYVLMAKHKSKIENIKTTERKPLEVQRERNDAYLRHWANIDKEKSKK
jgi:hypothetical protein